MKVRLSDQQVNDCLNYYQRFYGVMSVTEPTNYREGLLEVIEKTLNR
ncbi:hypothetical protein HV461_18010 [Bacillus sporothermodurans]|nr:hypothetical protein [Heyndrickxia sporothermodurans]MBL5769230.1 hypothetical protein [Heyndrickxia sporothermodurans]MBL5812474.1 hypothetical protein [Heyndrickxia sporothermodurans]MBL5851745.1 hypothetical protein [Heyndrickxia sporothermodurans]MBL5867866.1 hypothetical protein [Heyndrickxia sporothermodurans]MBL5871725.1 hypothetical protein [Heyndrickxia sporothermodurans]